MILFKPETQVFHISNKYISYIMEIEEGGYLAHLYFGKKVNDYSGNFKYPRMDRSFSPNLPNAKDRLFSLDTLMMEYPGNGFGDFRESAYNLKHGDGSTITDFRYKSHRIQKGKEKLFGLPATYGNEEEAETLVIQLEDKEKGLLLELSYTIFQEYAALTKSARIINNGETKTKIKKLASQSIDFPNQDLDLLHLNGTWGRECQIVREKIEYGTKVLDSKRGSSSHQQNPCLILAQPQTTEFQGEAFSFCLIYSGNHEMVIQKDPYKQTRIIMGINSFNFDWQLNPNEMFQTPEVVLSYSSSGLNKLSAVTHDFFNYHLIRGDFKGKERPTLINNWEATYFDFDEEKLLNIIDEAKDLGIEMFVLDDGWFGKRENDDSSLGDWFENRGKIKNGLSQLANQVHSRGMKFGIWYEPEMISEDSNLFRQHPDWALSVPGRERSPSRSQYVLDFSRKDVRENIYRQMKELLNEVEIDYIKWDLNRNMTDVYSAILPSDQQGEVFHRYILGLYEFLENLVEEFPNILFESCSGGGGRFDAGMLYYMPQTWTSDNTDAIARLKIQYGTSMIYPISSMGAHVSAVPNHQTGRNTSMDIRGNAAMAGVFGYELDITQLKEEEKKEIKEQVAFYKEHRRLMQFGRFIRLRSPFEENDVAWMFVAEDQSEAMVFYYRVLAEASYPLVHLQLSGLKEEWIYESEEMTAAGDELMNLGFYIDPNLFGDYATKRFYFKRISPCLE
ncbi:alpha-galactosidase [Aequitasia blattaphilus]|uniref:Alpha-galactosidase n=1 Tax=Aequitasia blattaphilus TaxID=2949332 RepID=A0ABT1EDS8_9FIRM|nr:alpha-galactosidase [Aequitasia blattaphilus]MCP1102996.1 alpha-galactosidase [Aequitasia blattaphilus]MCR8615636.1 alpha-galactosidase [Aequitasia blattaphilus]